MFPLGAILDIGSKLIDRLVPDPESKARAQLELMQMQQTGELAQLNADISEQQELTKRAQADMLSDSWLSKNIRPLSLIAIFGCYIVFAVMSAFGIDTNDNYTLLLGQWGQLAFGFYFGSRGLEKIAEMKYASKNQP